jgi:hypothetical protein
MIIVWLNLGAVAFLAISLWRARAGRKLQGAAAAVVAALFTTGALAASVFSDGSTMLLGLLASGALSVCIASVPRASWR